MKNKIEKVRDDLHREMESKEKNREEVLKLSKELDHLIIKYHKEDSIAKEQAKKF